MPPVAEHDALPTGTRLGEFEIERVLGVGGFGIVYLAFDHALERQIAIKEYMPAALAARRQGALDVSLRANAHAETFALGLRSFINEARLLARFDHPALVKVYRFWEQHGTAYMVMPYYRGHTLQQARRDMTEPPDETWLRQVIEPVLGALDCLHREQVFHRDIAPDNILLLDDGDGGAGPRPVLLDLGAARHVIGDHTQSLTAILKPSFAPIEQYAETVQLRQGAWTDLYALAAVVHFCITGRPPTPASARAVHDDLPKLGPMSDGLASAFGLHYSASFLNAVDHALAVKPQDRPDSILAWRQELAGIVNVGQPGSSGESDGWVPQTVLIRPAHGHKPAGHQAIEARAYLTTVPAAGTLRSQPKWPVSVAKRNKTESPPAPAAIHAPAEAESVQNQRWAWGMVFVLVVAVSGLWAQQRHAARESSTGEAPAVAATVSGLVGMAASAPDASTRNPAVLATRPDAELSQTTAADEARKGRKRASNDAQDPLNPRQACGSRTFISLAICMKQHCSRPAYAGHAECRRMTEQEQRNQHGFP